MKEELLDYLSA